MYVHVYMCVSVQICVYLTYFWALKHFEKSSQFLEGHLNYSYTWLYLGDKLLKLQMISGVETTVDSFLQKAGGGCRKSMCVEHTGEGHNLMTSAVSTEL